MRSVVISACLIVAGATHLPAQGVSEREQMYRTIGSFLRGEYGDRDLRVLPSKPCVAERCTPSDGIDSVAVQALADAARAGRAAKGELPNGSEWLIEIGEIERIGDTAIVRVAFFFATPGRGATTPEAHGNGPAGVGRRDDAYRLVQRGTQWVVLDRRRLRIT